MFLGWSFVSALMPGLSATPAAVISPQAANRRPVWVTALVSGLLALYFLLSVGAKLHKGPSFDEPEELAIGCNIWVNGDFRMEGANGDLVKRWATLPYLWMKPRMVPMSDPNWLSGFSYGVGRLFFFNEGNPPETLLLAGRAMMALIGVATGLLIFICAAELAGHRGGLAALALFAFSPNMLSFGAMVSTEMTTSLALLGSTWCIWKLLHRVTWGRLAGSLAFFALLALSKPSALVIFPITAILIAVKLMAGKPLAWQLGWTRLISSRARQMGVFLGLAALHGLIAWSTIWADYDFRYAATPPDAPANVAHADEIPKGNDPVDPIASAFLNWASDTRFLPKGFIEGADLLLTHNEERDAFLDGQWKVGGWPAFFFIASWEKTSPALILLFIIGFGGWLWTCWGQRLFLPAKGIGLDQGSPLYNATIYLTILVVFYATAATQDLNIGQRHVLPTYPALYILGGAAIAWTWGHRAKWVKLLIAGLFFMHVMEAVLIYPDFLAYFNPLVGGPEKGYQHLVDSSLDWGMDLPGLKHWLDQNNPKGKKPVFLAYFGTDLPSDYSIKCFRLPSFPDWDARGRYALAPGIYAISATLFQTVYTTTFGPWNKVYEQQYQKCLHQLQMLEATQNNPSARAALLAQYPDAFWEQAYSLYEKLRFARLCAWLRHNETPDTSSGYSILIWDLDTSELRAALDGPPAELADEPIEQY
jgi:hypothetical protein